MNHKKFFAGIIIAGSILSSCNNKKTPNSSKQENKQITEQQASLKTNLLVGSWKDQSSAALHFSLFEDGRAKSDNMRTLLYQKWSIKNNQLFLTLKSIGNKTSSIDTEIYEIIKLDSKLLILKKDNSIYKYKKIEYNYENYIGDNGRILQAEFLANNNEAHIIFKGKKILLKQEVTASGSRYTNQQYELVLWHGETILKQDSTILFKQTPKILKGKLIIGHEAQSFEPFTGDKEFWLTDRTGILTNKYKELTKHDKAYTAIFAEIKFINKGKAKDGFAADYDGVVEVISVLQTRKLTDKECK